jgi:G:T/U-mismatch repair DNA glycosylase
MVVVVVVTAAAAILAAAISVVEAMAISAVEATASATRILAVGTTAGEGSRYPTHFRTGVFTVIVLLPDTALGISARSETPRSHREAAATR